MIRWLIAVGQWAVLLPLWRRLVRDPRRHAPACLGVAILWCLTIIAGSVAIVRINSGGPNGDGANQELTPMPTPTSPSLASAPSPAPPTDPVLVGAGDIASCASTSDEATAELLDIVFSSGVDGRVFTTGDNVYESGTDSKFANCYDTTWGRHRERTRPSPGNHDYGAPGASGYFKYFGAAAGDPSKGYYSYDLGTWHIVVINSNCSTVGGCGAGSPQEQWLRTDLAAHPAACTLAYWHHPRFSSGSHGNSVELQAIWQALYDYGADVVLNGHDHDYERFAPQDPNGGDDPVRGIREFVVGTGGKDHSGFGAPLPNSEARNDDTFGVLKLTLRATSYRWQFISEAGKSFADSGAAACRTTTPVPTPTPTPIGAQLIGLLESVTTSTAYRYGAKDDTGSTMDTLKDLETSGRGYLGVYHTLVGGVFSIKVATSSDLLNWTHQVDLDAHASQPTVARLSDGAYLVAYERDSPAGSWIRFRYYRDRNWLLQGIVQRTFDAGRTLSACAEGTPSIYSATLSPGIEHSTNRRRVPLLREL